MLKTLKAGHSIQRIFSVITRSKVDTLAVEKSGASIKLKDQSLAQLSHIKIKNSKHNRPPRGLHTEEVPIPVSPQLGPYHVTELKLSDKKYRWCTCGLGQKQPFCDSSCKGTSFKPLRFTVEEKAESIDLCGCKYSKSAPYCDGETCVNMQKSQ